MDYEKLNTELPKEPIKWTVNDIEVWLRFIGLENLYPKFKQLAIDGSILSSLTKQDLREQLGVKSEITIKKIMSWITKGLKQYEEYLKVNVAPPSGIYSSFDPRQITQKPKFEKSHSLIEEQSVLITGANVNASSKQRQNPTLKQLQRASNEEMQIQSEQMEEQQQDCDKKKQFQLIIQQHDGPQTSFFSVKQQGAKIGRHSSNQILILDQSISRYHAQIIFKDGHFYLKDSGSTTGTFIKITQKSEIQNQMIFQMGSNQFWARIVNGSLFLEVIEGPSHALSIQIPKDKVSIGRKQNNELFFPDDQHLSNVHATIQYSDGKYYLEDMGTTNGTWRRLSKQSHPSNPYQLADKVIFKIGSGQTYCCKIKTAYVSQKSSPNACIICYENDKDCVYMPCKHNTACIKCSKNLKECPICRFKIEDFIRIYKY